MQHSFADLTIYIANYVATPTPIDPGGGLHLLLCPLNACESYTVVSSREQNYVNNFYSHASTILVYMLMQWCCVR